MKPPPPFLALGSAAFAGGWSLMMLEILGGRLMAPHFGYSVYQWGAIIGVVMTFMAAGYWMGGLAGDGPDARRRLPLALLAGAAWAALTPWFGPGVLARIAATSPPDEGAILAAAALLGVPSLALAMVSPLCAGMLCAGTGSGGAAAAAGRVYAVGTVGSIGGTFFASFAAIPHIGVSAGYAAAAGVLALGLAAVAGGRLFAVMAGVLAVAAVPAGRKAAEGFALYRETPHNTIYVREDGPEVRLHLNVLNATQTRIRRDGQPTGLYYDLFPGAPALAAPSPQPPAVLILGLAGGAAATGIAAHWPGAAIVGVELDPAVVEVAYERFGLGQAGAGVRAVVADARRFVEQDQGRYDLIVIDLYTGASIPFYTATREFFAAVARRLAPGGAVLMNVAAPLDRDVLVGPLAATLNTALPSVFVTDAGRGNWFLIGTAGAMAADALKARLYEAPAPAIDAARTLARTLEPAPTAGQPVLTDDRSDIDLRTLTALFGRR